MPTAVKFTIRAVHDPVHRRRAEGRKAQLIATLSEPYGGYGKLGHKQRGAIERAAEVMALVECARIQIGDTTPDHAEHLAFERLRNISVQLLTEVGSSPNAFVFQ